ncbi:MAG: cytochrome C assembly protein [Clostridia bacterium]|nr:MAG: cytochrome C assembly protein [Clostridia bacterium]
MLVAIYAIFIYAPVEKTLLEVQKIFYVHVGTAWNAFLAFFVVFVASVAYLRTREARWDRLGSASAEIGVMFTTLVLITGPIWARSSWNMWWTWEPRLTTTLILWFIYVAYLLIRATAGDERRGILAAVFGIIGFVDVPIVYLSVQWWGSHPIVLGSSGGGLPASMLTALILSVLAFTALYLYLLRKNLGIQAVEEELKQLKEELRQEYD